MTFGFESLRRWFGMAGVPALVVLATLSCGRPAAPETDSASLAGKTAPDFSLLDLTGRTVRLSDSAGRVRLIDFWATWCPPCREAIPDLNQMSADYEKDGLSVIGISMDDDASKTVPPFVEKYKIRYTMLVGNDEVADAFGGVVGLPTTILLDRDGKIVKSWIGGIPKEIIEQGVRSALGLDPKA